MELVREWGPHVSEPRISVVIPIYNEARILAANLEALAAFFAELPGRPPWHFVLVENGSADGTRALAQEVVRRWPPSRVVLLDEPNYGEALKAGLRAAAAPWVFLVDIEQWDFPFFRWAWENRDQFDLFLGSKRADPGLNHQQPYRRVLSAGLNFILQVFFGFTGSDTHGPKLLNREALASIIDACVLDRGQFDTELVLRALRARKRVVEAPIEYWELRPHRNWMFKKIFWNALALRRLRRVMAPVPFQGTARFYRYPRELVEAGLLAPEKGGS